MHLMEPIISVGLLFNASLQRPIVFYNQNCNQAYGTFCSLVGVILLLIFNVLCLALNLAGSEG
jgi:hypothetical protein